MAFVSFGNEYHTVLPERLFLVLIREQELTFFA